MLVKRHDDTKKKKKCTIKMKKLANARRLFQQSLRKGYMVYILSLKRIWFIYYA